MTIILNKVYTREQLVLKTIRDLEKIRIEKEVEELTKYEERNKEYDWGESFEEISKF